ncbi:Uncharacterised protein [Mycolicibacterium vanbaalenii]|uniref:Uncharacterized protein n=1 Tax=Mycolicibacterium vanbaalenii TaxID=110539 RepID=A0A5S9Q9S5_MYCVN|nr:Uncharacterised protein [Mycolicibacterium vanbaalenii]
MVAAAGAASDGNRQLARQNQSFLKVRTDN